jgi:hypothetical protein|tara:strand:- start:403 stop:552 length:150 start_codon:yes stop_codon:yes gene_type:complete
MVMEGFKKAVGRLENLGEVTSKSRTEGLEEVRKKSKELADALPTLAKRR